MTPVAPAEQVTHPAFAARRTGARPDTWWGRAWLRAVEEAAYAEPDLRRSRTLSRSGHVGPITVSRGGVVATLTDGAALVTAVVRLPMLDDAGVAALAEVVAAEPGRLGALLAGDLPHDLVEHAEEAGVELLPFGTELEAGCTCRAWIDPCSHALAVLRQVTWLLEADPLVLLHLRGVPRDVLLARVHELGRAAPADRPEPERSHDPEPEPGYELQLDTAADAAERAARLVDLLDHPVEGARVDHLF